MAERFFKRSVFGWLEMVLVLTFGWTIGVKVSLWYKISEPLYFFCKSTDLCFFSKLGFMPYQIYSLGHSDSILSIKLNSPLTNDVIWWPHCKGGSFWVKSGVQAIQSHVGSLYPMLQAPPLCPIWHSGEKFGMFLLPIGLSKFCGIVYLKRFLRKKHFGFGDAPFSFL